MLELIAISPQQVRPTLHEGQEDSPNLGTTGMQQFFDAHPNLNTAGINQVVQTQNANNAVTQSHMDNRQNPHSVTKAQVGLGSADNTSDRDKPISLSQQTALDRKTDKAVQEPINQGFSAEVAQLRASKADITYVENRFTNAVFVAQVYSDMQDGALREELLTAGIYTVLYFDPADGGKKTLQEILDNLSIYNIDGYTWKEIELKDLTIAQFETMELDWNIINKGEW